MVANITIIENVRTYQLKDSTWRSKRFPHNKQKTTNQRLLKPGQSEKNYSTLKTLLASCAAALNS